MSEILFKEESYIIVGICMEIYRELGMGFKEAIYKEAMQIEFERNNIPFVREKKFGVNYKGIPLRNKFYADFILYDNIVLEIKSSQGMVDAFVAQTINYLKASGLRLGLVINFGEKSLVYKRVVF